MKAARCRFDVALAHGGAIRIQPLGRWAKPYLVDGLARTSPAAQTRRFGAPRAGFTDAELDYLTRVDGCRTMALGARDVATRRGAGVARWVRDGAESAEAAILIVDEFARRGVGRWLMAGLIVAAKRAGLARLHGETHADNHAMLGLAEWLGARARYAGGGRTVLEFDLRPAWPESGAGPLLACVERRAYAPA